MDRITIRTVDGDDVAIEHEALSVSTQENGALIIGRDEGDRNVTVGYARGAWLSFEFSEAARPEADAPRPWRGPASRR